jgi:OOP family OmpA-OmpF porin
MNAKNFFALLISTALISGAAMAQSQDFARNKGSQPVVTKSGDCVLTKWQGGENCGAEPAPAPAPAPVAAPAPAPAPEIAYEKRVVYFDFAKSTLTPESVQKLDDLISVMAGYTNITKAEVVGFADIMGNREANQKLGADRAFAVRDYIASRTTIPVEAMGVKSLGEDAPYAKCDGIKNRVKKIECLGPDRRVEVEFNYQK